MTFREASAWIAVVSTLAIWGFYFWQALAAVLAGQLDDSALFWLFAWCMGLTIAVMLLANIGVAVLSRQQMDAPPDEREALFDARANRIGLTLLEITLTIILIASFWLPDLARTRFPDDPTGAVTILLVHAVLLALVTSAVIREIAQIIQFRMSA